MTMLPPVSSGLSPRFSSGCKPLLSLPGGTRLGYICYRGRIRTPAESGASGVGVEFPAPSTSESFRRSAECRSPESRSLADGRAHSAPVCGCRACPLGASNDSRRLPVVPTVGDSRHGRFCLSTPGGIARSNRRCYAISVERKRNTAGTARAIDVLLEGLNPAQRSAATYGIEAEQGPPPLLIAAGAG